MRCDSRSFTQSVTYFETDVASGSSAAIVSACLFVFRHLWLILVELLRQSPALLLQSVHRCESTREHQKWRLQHEAADYTSRQPVGAILEQDFGSGLQPITFASRKLSATEIRYSAYEREMLGIVWALGQWIHYFQSPSPIIIQTYHAPLRHLPIRHQ